MVFHFGESLKELRKQAGLTQKQLAERLQVTKSVISYYELHERTPSPDILIKLASIFHVSTDQLLGIDPAPRIDVSGLNEQDILLIRQLVDSLRNKKTRHETT